MSNATTTDALNRGIAALDTLAAVWAAKIDLASFAKSIASNSKTFDERVKMTADALKLAWQEGALEGRESTRADIAALEAEIARLRQQIEAAQKQEPFAYATHHDDPMLWLTFEEAAAYCDDDEQPILLYAQPVPAGEDARDAARYQWLTVDHEDRLARAKHRKILEYISMNYSISRATIDAAIDVAMAASPARDGKEGQ